MFNWTYGCAYNIGAGKGKKNCSHTMTIPNTLTKITGTKANREKKKRIGKNVKRRQWKKYREKKFTKRKIHRINRGLDEWKMLNSTHTIRRTNTNVLSITYVLYICCDNINSCSIPHSNTSNFSYRMIFLLSSCHIPVLIGTFFPFKFRIRRSLYTHWSPGWLYGCMEIFLIQSTCSLCTEQIYLVLRATGRFRFSNTEKATATKTKYTVENVLYIAIFSM